MVEFEGVKESVTNGGKVFVFTAPRFEINESSIQKQVQLKRKHFNWEVSNFEVDLNPSKSRKTPCIADEGKFSIGSTESTESELNLNYESKEVRNSVIAYLEETFSEISAHFTQGLTINTEERSADSIIPKTTFSKTSTQQEYEFSLEQSQKHFDKMQGFVEMSIDGTASWKSETQLNFTEGFSQTECTQSFSDSSRETLPMRAPPYVFTKLSNCINQPFSNVNIFVVVLQVNPVKEIQIKSGINCGQYVKVSSILVGDPTKEYFKLTFWRKAAEWVTGLRAGDVVVVRKLKVEKWNQELYGQSTYGTTLVNLRRDGVYRVPAQWLTIVSMVEAKSLLKWLRKKHRYLVVASKETAPCQDDIQWKTLKQFAPNTLVHYRGKIVKVLTYAGTKGKYEFDKRKVNKIVAVAIDEESSEEVPICLWGSQATWQYDLKSKIGHIWSFTFLRVECSTIHGQLCLHTTPQSTKSGNEETCLFSAGTTSVVTPEKAGSMFTSISELLEADLNGKASISAGVTKIMHSEIVNVDRIIDKTSDLVTIRSFFRELVYLGCKLCLRVLKQDHNGIYTHCSYCIQHSTYYRYGVMYCFKPCVVYLSDKSASIVATSCHESTSKLLKDVKPGDVLEDDNDKLFQRMQDIFNTMYCSTAKVVLNCETVLDENGFVKNQNFELLDLQM